MILLSETWRLRPAARRRGFTLLELVVVMLLLALGVSLIATSIGHGLGGRRPRAFIEQFAGLCRQARRRALNTGRPVSLVIDGESRRCRLDDRRPGLKIPENVRIEVEDRVSGTMPGLTTSSSSFPMAVPPGTAWFLPLMTGPLPFCALIP